MRHKIGFNRLGRRPAHRKALKRNMVTSLLLEERIKTTQTKALEVRRLAEKMVTRAREDSVHNRRMIGRDIKNKKALAKLFTEIGPRYKSRAGGYTRVLKLGPRSGDAAEMVLLEFVDREGSESELPTKKKKAAAQKSEKKSEGRKSAAKKEENVVKQSPAEPSEPAGAASATAADSGEVQPARKAEQEPAAE